MSAIHSKFSIIHTKHKLCSDYPSERPPPQIRLSLKRRKEISLPLRCGGPSPHTAWSPAPAAGAPRAAAGFRGPRASHAASDAGFCVAEGQPGRACNCVVTY